MSKSNKWYFYNEKEIVEIEKCRYWYEVIGRPECYRIDSYEERNRIFDTRKECVDYAFKYLDSEQDKIDALREYLNDFNVYEF